MHCPFGFLFVWLYVCVCARVETIFQWEGQCVCVFQMDGKKIKLVELMNSGNISLLFPEPLFIQILSVVYFWEYVWEKKDWFIIWFYYWFYLGNKGINLSITSFSVVLISTVCWRRIYSPIYSPLAVDLGFVWIQSFKIITFRFFVFENIFFFIRDCGWVFETYSNYIFVKFYFLLNHLICWKEFLEYTFYLVVCKL